MAAPLSTLRARIARRKKRRARQRRLYRKTGNVGHRDMAREHGRVIRRLRRRLRQSGTGAWGGTKSIIDNEVVPVARRYGVPITSRKRAANHPLTISNPSSDHSALAKESYAIDFGTYNGAGLAHSIANELGIRGYSTGNYAPHYIERAGVRFRVQILWAVAGHFDHVHVGIRRG